MTDPEGGWTPAPPASVYERWVRALRAWVTDPSVRLEDLPPLAEDTYDPQTYARLLNHMQKSIDQLMENWKVLLSRALSRVTDEHELGRELVALRPPLARRASLGRLPNLPDEIRRLLHEETVSTINGLQTELEEILGDPGKGARIDRAAADRLVAVARAAPLTEALTMTPSTRNPAGPTSPSPERPPLVAPGPGTPAAPRRARWSNRVIGPNTSQ